MPHHSARASLAIDFSRLTRSYRALEFLAFGRDLERARFRFLELLCDARAILVLGEGDGRCLARLCETAPLAQIHCIDSSPGMIAAAAARSASQDRSRIHFVCADATTTPLPKASLDGVITCFFLDCFEEREVSALVNRVAAQVSTGGRWLFADFVIPAHGWGRLRARAWVGLLYIFFGWSTGLKTRRLPPSERILRDAGFALEAVEDYQAGLIRSAVYRKIEPPPPPTTEAEPAAESGRP